MTKEIITAMIHKQPWIVVDSVEHREYAAAAPWGGGNRSARGPDSCT